VSNAEKTLPTSASIVQFRHGIAVTYSLEKQSAVSMDIVSLTGVRVATVNKGTAAAGKHVVVWDWTDQQGKLLPAGSYIAICRINNRTVLTKKIMLLQ
jgi:flagellar hook assembly protein FlgD